MKLGAQRQELVNDAVYFWAPEHKHGLFFLPQKYN